MLIENKPRRFKRKAGFANARAAARLERTFSFEVARAGGTTPTAPGVSLLPVEALELIHGIAILQRTYGVSVHPTRHETKNSAKTVVFTSDLHSLGRTTKLRLLPSRMSPILYQALKYVKLFYYQLTALITQGSDQSG